jgi:hypothetical protein
MHLDLPARTNGKQALGRFVRAYQDHDSKELELLKELGARVLASGAAVLGLDPRSLGWALADGQIATLLTGGERHIPGDLVERRVEIAIACAAGWAEAEAKRLRLEANSHADHLVGIAERLRRDYADIQRTLYVEATSLRQMPTTRSVLARAAQAQATPIPVDQERTDAP